MAEISSIPVFLYTAETTTLEVIERIAEAKQRLGRRVLILGHHYQRDDVIQFADRTGDSFELSRYAATIRDAEYIVFCGVHFMAETADILTSKEQVVILPDLAAGCSLADMATLKQVKRAWEDISCSVDEKVIPIAYINSSAAIKAFCGAHDGAVCTSSSARALFAWAFEKGEKVFFIPDEHLGRNTAFSMGIALHEMIVWDPLLPFGGNTPEDVRKARVILWKGYCGVHQAFLPEYVDSMRERYPGIKIIVHPECSFDVVQKADIVGSTSRIVSAVEQAQPGTAWAIGTEYHLVNRLMKKHPEQFIVNLAPPISNCTKCTTMYRISPEALAFSLERLVDSEVVNRITVPDDIAEFARVALDRMMRITSNPATGIASMRVS